MFWSGFHGSNVAWAAYSDGRRVRGLHAGQHRPVEHQVFYNLLKARRAGSVLIGLQAGHAPLHNTFVKPGHASALQNKQQ